MRILFNPGWIDDADISKSAAVKKRLIELGAEFFNWLFATPVPFTSKYLPKSTPVELFKVFMAQPEEPVNYYGQVIALVENGTECSLADLYGAECSTKLRWAFAHDSGKVVARLVEARSGGFDITDEAVAKVEFCAELFKFMRSITRVVDDTYSTSTQFAVNEVLTQLYACHLITEGK